MPSTRPISWMEILNISSNYTNGCTTTQIGVFATQHPEMDGDLATFVQDVILKDKQ